MFVCRDTSTDNISQKCRGIPTGIYEKKLRLGSKTSIAQGHVNGPYANHGLIITQTVSHYRR